MKKILIFIIFLLFFIVSCSSQKEQDTIEETETKTENLLESNIPSLESTQAGGGGEGSIQEGSRD